MYNTHTNNSKRNEIMKIYETHLKNLMDLEDGEHEIRKKKLQGGFLPMLLPILGGLLSGRGHSQQEAMNNEGYARDEGVVNVNKRGRGRPRKEVNSMEGKGIISDLGIPGVSQVAGLFGLGKTGAGKTGAGKTGAGHSNSKPKKTSAWIEFVKKYSKEKGIPYKQALREAGPHYKK